MIKRLLKVAVRKLTETIIIIILLKTIIIIRLQLVRMMSICTVFFILLTSFVLSNSFILNPDRCTTNNVKLSVSNPQTRSTQLLAITPLVANGKRYEAESGSSMMLVSWSFGQFVVPLGSI
jgi:hypothetical protein